MQRCDFDQVKADVVGRWPGVFQELGIKVGDGKHCACPLCGGSDRFRMDDGFGKGTWICNQCGAGSGWDLVMRVLGCEFKDAVEQVAPLVSKIPIGSVESEHTTSPEVLRYMFSRSVRAHADNLVGLYLRMRGLQFVPPRLRYAASIREPETGSNMPAMLAVVTMPDGAAVTMHRTFLDKLGRKAKIENPRKLMPIVSGSPHKKTTGGAIRLYNPTDDGTVGVAEGIETAIACTQLFKIPTWATISATMMSGFIPPPGVKTVCVFGDNDENYTGQKAAYSLANRLVVTDKLTADVQIPERIGDDWLDELNRLATEDAV